MVVITSIHQPNWDTISLFDRLLILAQGRTTFFGPLGKFPTSLHLNINPGLM